MRHDGMGGSMNWNTKDNDNSGISVASLKYDITNYNKVRILCVDEKTGKLFNIHSFYKYMRFHIHGTDLFIDSTSSIDGMTYWIDCTSFEREKVFRWFNRGLGELRCWVRGDPECKIINLNTLLVLEI